MVNPLDILLVFLLLAAAALVVRSANGNTASPPASQSPGAERSPRGCHGSPADSHR